jgi:hypothetical protein
MGRPLDLHGAHGNSSAATATGVARNSGLAIRHFFRPLRNIRGVRGFIDRMGYARSICEDKPVGDLTIIK